DFVKMIRDLDLFEQKTVTFQPRNPDGSIAGELQKIAEYWAISEERFNQLPDAKYMELKASGAIGAIYAHLVSLLNWQRVVQRAMRMQVSPNPQPAPAAV
ncbi:MAG: peptidase, partial [Hyphomonadaceae bacterium BRH_c29]